MSSFCQHYNKLAICNDWSHFFQNAIIIQFSAVKNIVVEKLRFLAQFLTRKENVV